MGQIKLLEIVRQPEGGEEIKPQERVVDESLAIKMLRKSRSWKIHPDEKKVFINDGDDSAIYAQGKVPKEYDPEGVHLISKEGNERFVDDVDLAEKMLRKSFRKKTWMIDSNKEKNFKFDEKSLRLVKKPQSSKKTSDLENQK